MDEEPRRGSGHNRSLLATLAFPRTVFGQSATGRIAGIVLDPTRAAIPGAEVIVRSESTGGAIGLRTNAVGAFTAAALLPGLYTVEVSADGFRRHTVEGQKVDVARATSLPPIVLGR